MKKCVVLLSVILALSLSLPTSAAEADTGSIEGSVTNGTAGGSSVAALEVVLTMYAGIDEVGAVISETNTEGRYTFDGLAAESGYIYQTMVNFQGVEYYSQALTLDDEGAAQGVDITVFETTTSDETISVVTSHTVVYPGQSSIQVNEYFMFANNSDLTYIGTGDTVGEGSGGTLKYPLAEGATAITYTAGLMDCCVVPSEDGLIDTMPVKPGMYEAVYSYEVPYTASGYTLLRSVAYPTTNYDLLVEYGGEIEIMGDTLTLEEPYHIEGVHFTHIKGQNLAKGDTLQVLFPELVNATDNGSVTWLITLIPVLIIAGLGAAYFIRRGRGQLVKAEVSTEDKKRMLLAELARLDDDFESGSINEEDYRITRAATKERLIKLSLTSEKGNTRN